MPVPIKVTRWRCDNHGCKRLHESVDTANRCTGPLVRTQLQMRNRRAEIAADVYLLRGRGLVFREIAELLDTVPSATRARDHYLYAQRRRDCAWRRLDVGIDSGLEPWIEVLRRRATDIDGRIPPKKLI